MSELISGVAAAAAAAATRIQSMIRETPLTRSRITSEAVGGEVLFKRENLQYTGSFKLRGAANRVLTLADEELARGCVVASSGNHGAAVAYALQRLGAPALVFVPENTSATKVDAIRRHGGEVRYFGNDAVDAERHARSYAEQHGMFCVAPYNDTEVIAGQGTCGIEITASAAPVDAAFIAVGGGGLLGGVGSVLKAAWPRIRIYACQPSASAVMARSVAAGRILDLPSAPTLSDGTAGGVEDDSMTFPLAQTLVDEFILVDEPNIAAAMHQYRQEFHEVVEGSAGVAIAGLRLRPDLARGRRSVVIICGGNVSATTLEAADRARQQATW